MDFSTIDRAGLTQGEFAHLVAVTRTTVNMWVRGKMQPHRFIADGVADMLATLEAAIERGDLPLAKTVSRSKRIERIVELVTTAEVQT